MQPFIIEIFCYACFAIVAALSADEAEKKGQIVATVLLVCCAFAFIFAAAYSGFQLALVIKS